MAKVIKQVKPGKSQGPDMIHPKIIREAQSTLTKPLTIIYKKSLEVCKIPEIGKCANASVIFKSGDRTKPCNYRPTSLTSVPEKVMERIIRDALVSHMTTNNLFCMEQQGFIKDKLCAI